MKYYLTLFCALLFAAPGWAQQTDLGQDVGDLELRYARYEAHQQRLESRLAELNLRVTRLKAGDAGVGRDLQLQTALRSSHSVAKRLTELHLEMRNTAAKLLSLYDRGIANSQDENEKKRFVEARVRMRNRAVPARLNIATAGIRNPLDGEDDLQEKADLLSDSEDKVRSQLRNIKLAIGRIEKRLKLQRHSRAISDNPFVETSPRRSRQTASAQPKPADTAASAADPKPPESGAGNANGKSGDSDPTTSGAFSTPQTPTSDYSGESVTAGDGAPPGTNGGGTGDPTRTEPAAPTGLASSVNISNKSVLDSTMLRDLRNGKLGGNAQSQLKALKNAEGQLKKLANELARKAKNLRKQAKSVKK